MYKQINDYFQAVSSPSLFGERFFLNILVFTGFMISFGMRCNMGMAKLEFDKMNNVSNTFLTCFHSAYSGNIKLCLHNHACLELMMIIAVLTQNET